MSKYLVRNTSLEEKLAQNVMDSNDYSKIISMIRNIVDDNWALYLDMLIENAVKNNNHKIIKYLVELGSNASSSTCSYEYRNAIFIETR